MNYGCNIGNEVVTNPTNQFPLQNQPTVELYNGQTLYVYYNGMVKEANKCYIVNPYAMTGKQCIANGKQGNIITYQDTDVTCIQGENVPLDNDIAMTLFIIFTCMLFLVMMRYKYSK